MQAATRGDLARANGHATVDVAVEFAHVYIGETFGPEHLAGAREATRQARRLGASGRSYSLSVLIDDYNPQDWTLDLGGFVGALQRYGGEPDHVVFESTLEDAAETLLSTINGREGRSLRRYVSSRGRMPCALLVAAWHLVRLGTPDLPAPAIEGADGETPFAGEESLTLLPTRFRAVEKRAMEIIEASPFGGVSPRIKHVFF